MVSLRTCCLCGNIRTGTFILGSLGIILGGVFLAPVSEFLNHHAYYVTEYVKSEREMGKSMDDDEIPRMAFFSRVFFTVLLSLDVIYILSCVLLLVGVSTSRHMMMLPWLVFTFLSLVNHLTLVLAFMISLPDYQAAVAVFAAAPSLILITYLWLVVYSCYQMIKKEEISLRGNKDKVTTESASHNSLSSLRENISRAIRGTPPPPYEVVTSKSPKPTEKKKEADENSCSSLVDLLHFKSSSEQSPRSTPSISRRSSDGRNSTKPGSPDIRKRTSSSTASDILMTRPGLPIPHKPLVSSQSQHQICRGVGRGQSGLRKSHSSMVSFHKSEHLIKFSRDSLTPAPAPASDIIPAQSLMVEKENSELSDEVSSMSSSSLSIPNTKIV